MRRNRLLTPMLVLLATGLSACGSSKAPGVVAAPSTGTTQAATSAAAPTTTTSSTPTTPAVPTPQPPSPLSKKPVVTVPKGPAPKQLVVKDLIKGTGPAATPTSTVTVNYVGALYKGGKEFDSSWKRGTTASFPLSGVIQGWQQGIPGMKVGGRRELIVPASLAYKNQAQSGIPANSALIFVIDLHGVS